MLDLLTKVAAAHPLVSVKPVPEAFMQEFGTDALLFELFFWTDDFDSWVRIQSEVAVAVNAALLEAKIKIAYPQHDLHLQSIEPAVADAFQSRSAPNKPPALSTTRGS